MRFRILLAAASAAILTGCVSYPPVKVVNGLYINDLHSFQMAIPADWKPVGELPLRFAPESRKRRAPLPQTPLDGKHKYPASISADPFIWRFGLSSDAVFVNDTGVIFLKVTEFAVDLRTLTQTEIRSDLQSSFAYEKHAAALASSVSDYTYTVSPRAITDEPTFLAQANFTQLNRRGRFQCETTLYAITHGDRSYSLRLGLISEEPLFEENLIVLEEMSKSLRRHTPPPRDVR